MLEVLICVLLALRVITAGRIASYDGEQLVLWDSFFSTVLKIRKFHSSSEADVSIYEYVQATKSEKFFR